MCPNLLQGREVEKKTFTPDFSQEIEEEGTVVKEKCERNRNMSRYGQGLAAQMFSGPTPFLRRST